MTELSKIKLAVLEEDFRSYCVLPPKIKLALASAEWKPEDINAQFRGSGGHNEPALNELLKREKNKSYLYYSKLYADITTAYRKLNNELKQIVDEYMWGMSSYLSWQEVAEREGISKSGAYDRRYKILETLAIERGIIYGK